MKRIFLRQVAILLVTVVCSVLATGITLRLLAPNMMLQKASTVDAALVHELPPGAERLPRRSDERMMSLDEGRSLWLFAELPDGGGWLRLGPMHVDPPDLLTLVGGVLSLVVIIVVAMAVSRPASRQLESLLEATRAFEGGNLGARAPVVSRTDLRSLALAFNRMADRREAEEQEREALIQGVAHELGTPLARMNFGLDFFRDAPDEAARAEQLASMEEEMQVLAGLVNELTTWLESGAAGVVDGSVDDAVVVVQACVTRARRYGTTAIALVHATAQPAVVAGPRDLARVLDNLVRNAERYAAAKIEVRVELRRGDVVITVDDDGPGIPVEARSRVFEPFTRLDRSRARECGGVGLGLAICQRLVARAGGTIGVCDAPSGGARFQVTWPRVRGLDV